MASAAERDPFAPPPPAGLLPASAVAMLAHLGLVAALTLGLNWRSSEPPPLEAELWSAVPQKAAAPAAPPLPPAPAEAPPPPPPPARTPAGLDEQPEADIALEQQRARQKAQEQAMQRQQEAEHQRKQEEKDRQRALEQEKEKEKHKKQEELEKKRLADEKAREAKQAQDQRREALRRSLALAEGEGSDASGTAARSSGPSAAYAGRIKARIKPNIVFTESVSGNPMTEFEVRLSPDGRINSKRMLRSSGVAEWDAAVERAIVRTEVLPKDIDGRVPPIIVLSFKPYD
jgi:colicin import membrane protein